MRRRLVLVVAATTGLVVVAFAIPLAALVRNVAHDRAVTAAERDAAALAPVLAVTTDDVELVTAAVEQTATGADGRLSVFTASTQIGDQTPADDRALALARDRGAGFSRETSAGAEIYSPVITGDGQTTVVRARVPDALLDEGVRTAWAALAAVGVVLVLAGCALADGLARSVTRDAADLAGTARALAGGTADARARPSAVSEIGDVAAALNALADRIDELRAAERERVADLSHRLRTPLTVLRLEADRTGIPAVTQGVDRLERDITQLIVDARRPLHDGLVDAGCDLTAVVRERARFWNALAEDDGRPTTTEIPAGPLVVRLAEAEAVAAIDALLNNVFTHTPDGTGYSIELRVAGHEARLTVHDDGPGIGNGAMAAVRGVSGAGSTGLGLDIVRHAARSAGGTVTIESEPAAGFTVHVDLPVVEPG
jgi:signal transduction histidine kinase